MAVVILPDAQDDLLSLQEYMLDQWGEWLKTEDEIFEEQQQDDVGNYPGTAVKELTSVGIFEYQYVFTSHFSTRSQPHHCVDQTHHFECL